MLKLNFKLKVPVANRTVTRDLEKVSEVVLRKAIRAWLRKMVESIPVWEGTARGTLKPLGRFIRVAVPISPVANPSKSQARMAGKLFQLGPIAGEAYGEFDIQETFPNFIFSFTEKLPYVVWNSFGQPLPEVRSAPWDAFDKASVEATQVIRTELRAKIGEAFKKALGVKIINV